MTRVNKPYQHFSYTQTRTAYLAGDMHLLVAIGWVAADRAFIRENEAKGNNVDNAAGRIVREVWKPLLAELDEQREAQRDAKIDAMLDADENLGKDAMEDDDPQRERP